MSNNAMRVLRSDHRKGSVEIFGRQVSVLRRDSGQVWDLIAIALRHPTASIIQPASSRCCSQPSKCIIETPSLYDLQPTLLSSNYQKFTIC
jgi:hypothetical protein